MWWVVCVAVVSAQWGQIGSRGEKTFQSGFTPLSHLNLQWMNTATTTSNVLTTTSGATITGDYRGVQCTTDNGTEVWFLSERVSSIALGPSQSDVYLLNSGGMLTVVDVHNGATLWLVNGTGQSYPAPVTVDDQGYAYIRGTKEVIRVSPTTHTVDAHYSAVSGPNQPFGRQSAAVGSGVMVAIANETTTVGYDKDTGKLLWSISPGAGRVWLSVTPPMVVPGHTLALLPSNESCVAVNLQTGAVVWQYEMGRMYAQYFRWGWALAESGDAVYLIAGKQQRLMTLSLVDGTPGATAPETSVLSVVVGKGVVYYTSMEVTIAATTGLQPLMNLSLSTPRESHGAWLTGMGPNALYLRFQGGDWTPDVYAKLTTRNDPPTIQSLILRATAYTITATADVDLKGLWPLEPLKLEVYQGSKLFSTQSITVTTGPLCGIARALYANTAYTIRMVVETTAGHATLSQTITTGSAGTQCPPRWYLYNTTETQLGKIGPSKPLFPDATSELPLPGHGVYWELKDINCVLSTPPTVFSMEVGSVGIAVGWNYLLEVDYTGDGTWDYTYRMPTYTALPSNGQYTKSSHTMGINGTHLTNGVIRVEAYLQIANTVTWARVRNGVIDAPDIPVPCP